MTIQDLFNMYLDTLVHGDDEYYCDERSIHSIGIEGFLKWLIDQPYEIKVIKLN